MLTLRTLSASGDPTMATVRAMLVAPPRRDSTLAVLGSAALCAACAVALAGAVILGPPTQGHGQDTPSKAQRAY